jgi:hypothetical protein
MSGETRTARHVGTVHFCPHLAPTSILNGSAVPPGTYSSAVRPPEQAEGVHDPCVTTDLNTLLTALYVKIDDEIGQVRCSGRPPLLSDSELVCLAVAQALLGFHSEARWLRYARKHLTGMFPHLPQRPGYHKRLKAALPLLKRMIRELAMDSDFWTDTVWIAVSILRIATEEAFAPPELIAMWRVVCMHAATVRAQRYEAMKPIRRKPSEYLRENVWVTTSGVAWAPAIMFCREALGPDRVLYAMDYPYEYVPEEVTAHENLPITPEEKAGLFQTNAERVFRL